MKDRAATKELLETQEAIAEQKRREQETARLQRLTKVIRMMESGSVDVEEIELAVPAGFGMEEF